MGVDADNKERLGLEGERAYHSESGVRVETWEKSTISSPGPKGRFVRVL